MATAGAAKSREAHRHRPKPRRHSMKPPVLDMTRLTARRAIRTQDRMVVGLYGDHHSLQAREDLLRLGQCQPQLRNIAEVTKRLDIHHVDYPRRTINPGFDQAQDPPHPQTPSQQPIGQSYRLRLYPPTSGTLPLAVLAGPIARDTGWPLTWIMGALSAGMLIAGLVSPRVGHLIDRHGGRPVLAGSAVLFAAGMLALAVAPNLPAFVVAWAVLGVAMGAGLYAPAFSALGRLYGDNARSAI